MPSSLWLVALMCGGAVVLAFILEGGREASRFQAAEEEAPGPVRPRKVKHLRILK